jgi:hypothetical protein
MNLLPPLVDSLMFLAFLMLPVDSILYSDNLMLLASFLMLASLSLQAPPASAGIRTGAGALSPTAGVSAISDVLASAHGELAQEKPLALQL